MKWRKRRITNELKRNDRLHLVFGWRLFRAKGVILHLIYVFVSLLTIVNWFEMSVSITITIAVTVAAAGGGAVVGSVAPFIRILSHFITFEIPEKCKVNGNQSKFKPTIHYFCCRRPPPPPPPPSSPLQLCRCCRRLFHIFHCSDTEKFIAQIAVNSWYVFFLGRKKMKENSIPK